MECFVSDVKSIDYAYKIMIMETGFDIDRSLTNRFRDGSNVVKEHSERQDE